MHLSHHWSNFPQSNCILFHSASSFPPFFYYLNVLWFTWFSSLHVDEPIWRTTIFQRITFELQKVTVSARVRDVLCAQPLAPKSLVHVDGKPGSVRAADAGEPAGMSGVDKLPSAAGLWLTACPHGLAQGWGLVLTVNPKPYFFSLKFFCTDSRFPFSVLQCLSKSWYTKHQSDTGAEKQQEKSQKDGKDGFWAAMALRWAPVAAAEAGKQHGKLTWENRLSRAVCFQSAAVYMDKVSPLKQPAFSCKAGVAHPGSPSFWQRNRDELPAAASLVPAH